MVLRKRFKGGYQANFWLGNQYHYIDREACQDEFKVTAKQEFGDNWETSELAKECYGFVIYNFGCNNGHRQEVSPLYYGQNAYIISPNGIEFADLSPRT